MYFVVLCRCNAAEDAKSYSPCLVKEGKAFGESEESTQSIHFVKGSGMWLVMNLLGFVLGS